MDSTDPSRKPGHWTDAQERAYQQLVANQDAQSVAATAPPVSTPAGWYPDPSMVNTERYWDGHRWTGQVAPSGTLPSHQTRPDAGATEPAQGSFGLFVFGLFSALFLPLIGFVIGVILLTKPRSEAAGVACMILSLVGFMIMASAL